MQFHLRAACVIAFTVCTALSAQASSLVTNGNFETTTNGTGQLGFNTDVTGWTTTGYNFVFNANTADTTGTSGYYGFLSLWGPKNGSSNGLGNSPTGGNFLAADGAYWTAPIQQTISGLNVGQKYTVGFDWAGAQQSGYTGPQTEQWAVSLGNQTQTTAVYNNPSHGFSGWMHESFTFTATSGSEALSFLAIGTPTGVPPFSLLDGVTMVAAVPEPETWALMLCGMGLIGAVQRRRRNRAA